MQFQVSRISRHECSAEEWQARVDLAAAHRLAVMHGLNEGIFNHLTPGSPWQSRPLLPDSVWHALVGGQGFFVWR
jgi:hypothetical protein